jgi:pyruvate kinase
MVDLPGPKIRIGQLAQEPIELKRGAAFTLTTNEIIGDRHRVFVSFPHLPAVVKMGDTLFLNDGSIQLHANVAVDGGPLSPDPSGRAHAPRIAITARCR